MARRNDRDRTAETETVNGRAAEPKFRKADFEQISKIGTRAFGDAAQLAFSGEVGDSHPLGVIMGIATGYKNGHGTYGEYTGLLGSFQWVPDNTNKKSKKVRSGVCYLPGTITGQLTAALVDGDSVKFAFDIGVRRVDKREVPIGYQYVITPLVESDNDPLAELGNQVAALLPAPAQAAE